MRTTRRLKTDESPRYLMAFLLPLFMTAVVFLPFVIMDNGYFFFYGDFNVQQIPFYQMSHDAVREGNIFWSTTTDLGANFIGSYSFYLLGSPFFWLTIPFPSEVVPHLMAPLYCLKFACATLTSYMFIKRFVKTHNYALTAALCYSFSGFSIFNVFFNHFHEPMIFFPLLLIAVEELMVNNRRGVVAIAVAINCIVNYFFFAGMVVFVIIYWIVRSVSAGWKPTWSKFFAIAIESVIGMLISMFFFLPSILAIMDNPRTFNFPYGYNGLFYGYQQRYGQIIYSLFFPPDLPAQLNFFTGSETKWSSVAAWLPLFSTTGVFAFMSSRKGHWAKRMFAVCAVMALVPFFNSAFFMFNAAFYGRWYYMIILIMCMMTGCALDEDDIDWNTGIWWTFGITAAIALIIGIYPQKVDITEENTSGVKFGLYKQLPQFLVWIGIALVCIILTAVIIKFYRNNKKLCSKIALVTTCVISVLWSVTYIAWGKDSYNNNHEAFTIPYCLNGGEDINLPDMDKDNYRINILDGEKAGYDNQSMFWQMPSIQSFHSIIPGSSMEFFDSVGIERNVGTRPDVHQYALASLLSVKWMFNYSDVSEEPYITERGYKYYEWQNGYNIYENTNFIPIGFTYDHYITSEDYFNLEESDRAAALIKAVMLNREQVEKYSDILTVLPDRKYDFSYDAFAEDCADRRETVCDTFEYDNHGFTATITTSSDELVCFSVPYEKGSLYESESLNKNGLFNNEGWTCEIDGQAVEIDKINVGMMGVRVSGGTHTIRFNYRTPGLYFGIFITVIGLLLLAVYLLIFFAVRKAANRKNAELAENISDNAELYDNNDDSNAVLDLPQDNAKADLDNTAEQADLKADLTIEEKAVQSHDAKQDEIKPIADKQSNEEQAEPQRKSSEQDKAVNEDIKRLLELQSEQAQAAAHMDEEKDESDKLLEDIFKKLDRYENR